MNIPFISFLITCKNEGIQLRELYQLISNYINGNEIIILDDYSTELETSKLEEEIKKISQTNKNISWHKHALNNNYSEHKNYGKSLCSGRYIFQIDADEIPSKILLDNINELLETNNDVDLLWIPRINDFRGVSSQHAMQWGWKLTPYENRYIVNWPDPQSRLFRNVPHIKWERRLHEKIEGAKVFSHLPPVYEYAIYHNKTIEKQIETNIRYNKEFSADDNQGFKH
jgi:hypothetical protein